MIHIYLYKFTNIYICIIWMYNIQTTYFILQSMRAQRVGQDLVAEQQ